MNGTQSGQNKCNPPTTHVVGPPTKCGTLGTPSRYAEVYRGEIVMARLCQARTSCESTCSGGYNVQGLFWTIQKCKTKRKRTTPIVLRPNATLLEGAIVIVPPPVHSMNVYPLWFADPSMFVNRAILLILVDIPCVKVDSCCWIYSRNALDEGSHLPIFRMLSSSNPANFIAHAPPARFECVSILSIGMLRAG